MRKHKSRNIQISPLKPNTSASDHQNNLNIVVDKLYAMCKIVAYLINPFLYIIFVSLYFSIKWN